MVENVTTPPGKTSTTPNAPTVPAVVTPVTAQTTPVVAPTPPVEPAAPIVAPVAAVTPTPPAETPVAPVVAPVVAAVVPENYEFVLEGDAKVDSAAIQAITPALKKAGMTQAAAQELVSDFAKYQLALPAAKNASDLEAIRKDPEIGLLNFGRTQNEINQALSAFTTPAERESLSKMGMANDPALVRMFMRIGRAMSEAPQTDQGGRPAEVKTTAQRLYGPKAQ